MNEARRKLDRALLVFAVTLGTLPPTLLGSAALAAFFRSPKTRALPLPSRR